MGGSVHRDGTGFQLGYKQVGSNHSTLSTQDLFAEYPVVVFAGTKLMFIYLDINHYQTVGDTKTTLLRVIDTNLQVENGYAYTIEPNHRNVFSNLDSLLFQISVNLSTEIGGLVTFAGGKKLF